jgi:class 3 adenylate cyclase/pimeloyl-ACP methyl ester carboxylesterase
MDMPPTRYAKTNDGVHVAYQVYGAGPLDILHATALWWHLEYQWTDPWILRWKARLARLGRMIEFDKRGTGLSDRVPTDRLPTLEQRVDDITAVLDAVGSTSAVLYGENHGAPLALLFAATYPERTRALVLSGGFARFASAPDYPWGFPEHLSQRVVEQMEYHWDEPHALRNVAPSRANDPHAQEWWSTMQRMSVSPSAAVALWNMAMATDLRDVLSAVHVPTLVLHSTDDRLIDVGCGRYLAEHIDGATMVELPGSDSMWGDFGPGVDAIEEWLTGREPEVESDRVLATVLFTDIVESTKQVTELGDREWKRILDRHDALVDRALERFRGRKVNPTGDGMLAIFDGPARAVQCACAIRDGVAALGIETRAGVHIGEIELRGDDVSGVAVHLGARVAALAGPSEVLVTRTLTDLVAGSGLRFTDRGEHELKGLPGTWSIYCVDGS